MMGKYCGDSIPSNHDSSNNEVLIHFQSAGYYNSYYGYIGFQLEYNPTGKKIILIIWRKVPTYTEKMIKSQQNFPIDNSI